MSTRGVISVAAIAAALVACGVKPPTQASSCEGDNCGSGSSESSSESKPSDLKTEEAQESALKNSSGDSSSSSSTASSGTGSGSGDSSGSAEKVPYDKDATEAALRRATRQVKANCGKASEEDGKRVGPWGTAKLAITLGHNGHVREVKVPDAYEGKAVGRCTAQAFQRATFPPWPGSDVTIDWDVEIVK